MFTDPNEHHAWLQQLVGDWTFTHGEGEKKASGTERVTAYSDLWIVADGRGAAPGSDQEMTMRTTLGYDPDTQRYVGTWIGSPMGAQFVYSGTREGNVLTLETSGPSMEDPTKTAAYKDIMTLHDDGTRTLRSQVKDPDGAWNEFMCVTYTRV